MKEALLRVIRNPVTRGPILITLPVGLLVGFVVGVFSVRSPEHTFLLRAIRDSVENHSCSGWAQDAASEERKDEVYRAVAQALIDWEADKKRQTP